MLTTTLCLQTLAKPDLDCPNLPWLCSQDPHLPSEVIDLSQCTDWLAWLWLFLDDKYLLKRVLKYPMKRNYILFNFVSPKPYKGTTLQEMFTTCFLNAWNPCDHACVVASLHSAQIKARILKAPRKVLHLVEANLRKVSGEKQKVFIDSKIYEHRSMKNNFYFWAAW